MEATTQPSKQASPGSRRDLDRAALAVRGGLRVCCGCQETACVCRGQGALMADSDGGSVHETVRGGRWAGAAGRGQQGSNNSKAARSCPSDGVFSAYKGLQPTALVALQSCVFCQQILRQYTHINATQVTQPQCRSQSQIASCASAAALFSPQKPRHNNRVTAQLQRHGPP